MNQYAIGDYRWGRNLPSELEVVGAASEEPLATLNSFGFGRAAETVARGAEAPAVELSRVALKFTNWKEAGNSPALASPRAVKADFERVMY